MTGESWRGPSKDGVPPQSVGRVLWRAKPSGRTARPHLLRISGARKSVVAVYRGGNTSALFRAFSKAPA
jgi:hypothetical protein